MSQNTAPAAKRKGSQRRRLPGDVLRKGLDRRYIRGYNFTRETTDRSQRLTRLSPRPNDRQAKTLPESHPTTQNQLPQSPACHTTSKLLPIHGEVAPKAPEGLCVGRNPATFMP